MPELRNFLDKLIGKYSSYKRFFMFGFVGGLGTVVNTLLLFVLTSYFFIYYLAAAAIATETAIIFNFLGNHFLTFREIKNKSSIKKKFVSFQLISLFSLCATLFILWSLTNLFGLKLLLVWNFLAILVTFTLNFALNSKFTWSREKKLAVLFFSSIFLFFVLVSASVSAELVAVSQLGYHPDENKQVVSYSNAPLGIFNVKDSGGNIVFSGSLVKAKDFSNNNVECQGNNPCLVGDFSSFKTSGNYYVETSLGGKSPNFAIDKDIFVGSVNNFLEFYNAMLQQDSAYHADFHGEHDPIFNSMADGSFIMEADQATLSLIRMGSAYRRNPPLLSSVDNYDIYASGKPDIQEYILTYVIYLEDLQGLKIEENSNGEGFRLNPGMKIENAFVPGPTNLSTLDIYVPGEPPQFLESVPVISLCGEDQSCIDAAALYFKCQVDEPCLNVSYVDKTGQVISHNNGFGVSRGWGYEFGCFADIHLDEEMFEDSYDPCMIFYPENSRKYTSETLLAYLEALPAVYDYDKVEAGKLFDRSISTYDYIKKHYSTFKTGDEDAGFYATSLFLLYDYTGNVSYLQEAHSMRNIVTPNSGNVFISDKTRAAEFYWEEYIRHKSDLNKLGLQYNYDGNNPEEFFRGKMFQDYKDAGPNSISKTAERVFQFDSNIQFQNSRYMLTEGLFASKTNELHSAPESFIRLIADSQMSWLTGMNGVQNGTSVDSPIVSYSFIFGIGHYPSQFHTRYFIDSGYKDASNGKIIGARGIGYQFFDQEGGKYTYLDGVSSVLGKTFGASGNGWHNESMAQLLHPYTEFKDGQKYIPGWINGVFDTQADSDVIFNYRDNLNTYEFTETTNEIVSTALELYAYMDGQYNNKSRHVNIVFNKTEDPKIKNGTIVVKSIPTKAKLKIDSIDVGLTPYNASLKAGSHDIELSLEGYQTNLTNVVIIENETLELLIVLNIKGGGNNSGINNTSTNLKYSNSSGKYLLWENDSGIFNVVLNGEDTIVWKVNGEVKKTSVGGSEDSFTWNPGILYTSNNAPATVRVEVSDDSYEWPIRVDNVINPFFEKSSGDEDNVLVHVFTNDNALVVNRINVTVENSGVKQTFTLQAFPAGNNETDWKGVASGLGYGNNYLTLVALFKNGSVVNYGLTDERAYYRNSPPPQNDGGNHGGGGGGNGGGGSGGKEVLEVVYVILDKNVLSVNETQFITLDAKSSNGQISRVEATFQGPLGIYQATNFVRIKGTGSYGTWSANLTELSTGLFELDSIQVWGSQGQINVPVSDRAFYVVDDLVQPYENLMIVYNVLSSSVAEVGQNVTFKMDARDSIGVSAINATVEVARNPSFNVPLKLVEGNNKYGTWEGEFMISEPDTTYKISSVTLTNGQESKTYQIKDRSVYSKEIPGFGITGSVIGGAFIKRPFVSTIIGFGLMFFILVLAAVGLAIRRRMKKTSIA